MPNLTPPEPFKIKPLVMLSPVRVPIVNQIHLAREFQALKVV